MLDKKLTPPLVPPRGEVNAQDAFDIGSFDDEDTRSVRVSEMMYPDFLKWWLILINSAHKFASFMVVNYRPKRWLFLSRD